MRRTASAMIKRLGDPNGFAGPVAKLASGTAIGHAITGAALIVLSRLYSPAEFGVLGMFSAIVFVVAVAACLRLDLAIALPEREQEAFALFILSLMAACAVGALSAAVIAMIPAGQFTGDTWRLLEPFLWLVPVNIVVIGIYSAIQNWFIRNKAYNLLAASRVAQSGVAAGTQIGAGLMGAGPIGLIAGFILNSGAGALFMARRIVSDIRRLAPGLSRSTLLHTLHRYRDFPRFSVWEALANSAAIQVPLLIIGFLSGSAELGQLTLAMTVIQAPMALFGTAAAQVFLSQAPERARRGQLFAFTLQTVRGLAVGGVPALILLGIAAPFLFPVLFGSEWERAGILVSWMTPWLLLQFISSPVSSVHSITGRLGLAMVLQIGGLAFRMGAIVLTAILAEGWESEAFALSGAVFYGVYGAIILTFARTRGDSVGSKCQN